VTPDWPRALRLALLAYAVGLTVVAGGGSTAWFLWTAYLHGGL
jgi:hypothetical protein